MTMTKTEALALLHSLNEEIATLPADYRRRVLVLERKRLLADIRTYWAK
jgi:hypothetical protein